MKSTAAILFETGQKLEICEVDVQDPGPGEVRIRMVAGGVCHSDLHVMTGHLSAPLPAILGHEGAGIVADVGAGVTSVRPGDHVIPLWRLSCGECEYCTGGRPALCPAGTEIRWSGRLLDGTSRFKLDGQEIKHFAGVSSFSNYTVLPEKAVLKIPDDLPLERAALLGCAVITGVGAVVNAAQVRPGRTVAVFGTGGVGINVVQGAVLAGAEKIIALDLLESRLEHAKRFGATHVVNASAGDPVEQIRDLTGGRGVDYAFEVVGLPVTMRQAYDSLWPSAAWRWLWGSRQQPPR
jgi:Zn-dependent alcohol dehydrogenase